MSVTLVLELVVLLAAIAIGARAGGVGMGLWGGVGLAVLVFGFGEQRRRAFPGEVLLIILTVIMAASAMEAAGGIDYLVRIAAGIIRKSPKHVTIIAPLVAYVFTFLAGTGHIFYPLLPVIYEVAMKGRHPARAADRRRDDRVAAGDHRQPGVGRDGGADRDSRRRRASVWCRSS